MKSNSEHEKNCKNRLFAPILVSFGFFLISMICIAVLAIVFGIIDRNNSRWLEKWLFIQLGTGFLFATISGYICRRMTGNFRGPLYYASGLFTLGLVEAIELMRYISTDVERWSALSAPVIAAIGVLLGAWSRGNFFSRNPVNVSIILRLALPIMVLATASLLAMFVLPRVEGEVGVFSGSYARFYACRTGAGLYFCHPYRKAPPYYACSGLRGRICNGKSHDSPSASGGPRYDSFSHYSC